MKRTISQTQLKKLWHQKEPRAFAWVHEHLGKEYTLNSPCRWMTFIIFPDERAPLFAVEAGCVLNCRTLKVLFDQNA